MIAPLHTQTHRRAGTTTPESRAVREERLYQVAFNKYIQHCPDDEEPQELRDYRTQHAGETAPYIPLPSGPTEFRIGPDLLCWVAHRWVGRGAIPDRVMEYVVSNRCLPPNETIRTCVGTQRRRAALRASVAA